MKYSCTDIHEYPKSRKEYDIQNNLYSFDPLPPQKSCPAFAFDTTLTRVQKKNHRGARPSSSSNRRMVSTDFLPGRAATTTDQDGYGFESFHVDRREGGNRIKAWGFFRKKKKKWKICDNIFKKIIIHSCVNIRFRHRRRFLFGIVLAGKYNDKRPPTIAYIMCTVIAVLMRFLH